LREQINEMIIPRGGGVVCVKTVFLSLENNNFKETLIENVRKFAKRPSILVFGKFVEGR
jgi:hypothetical protein